MCFSCLSLIVLNWYVLIRIYVFIIYKIFHLFFFQMCFSLLLYYCFVLVFVYLSFPTFFLSSLFFLVALEDTIFNESMCGFYLHRLYMFIFFCFYLISLCVNKDLLRYFYSLFFIVFIGVKFPFNLIYFFLPSRQCEHFW